MERPRLDDLDDVGGPTPGFDQLAAYKLTPKLGGKPEQEIAVLRERIKLKREGIEELIEYAGPAGSSGAQKASEEIRELEAEVALQETILRGERLSEGELERLAQARVDRSPRSRESGLARF